MFSRSRFLRGIVVAACLSVAAFALPGSVHAATGFFVLDFNDPAPNPETYTFQYNYTSTTSGADLIRGLEAALGGPSRPNGFVQTGAQNNFVTRLGYNGREIASNTPGNTFGYWNLWLSFDGTSWTSAQFGARDVTLSDVPVYSTNPFTGQQALSGAKYHGWRWVQDYRTESPQAPRTNAAIAAVVTAAPEPGALALALCVVPTVALVRRRKRA